MHPSKQLIEIYAKVLGTTPLDVYRTYLLRTLDLGLSHSNLANMTDDLLKQFYRHEKEDLYPKSLNFFHIDDLSRFEASLSVSFVIWMREERSKEWKRFYDKRVYDQLLDGGARREVKAFTLSRDKNKVWSLQETDMMISAGLLESKFMRKSARVSPCFVRALRYLLQEEEEEKDEREMEEEEYKDIIDLLVQPTRFFHVVKHEFILVSHIHSNVKRAKIPHQFETLAIVTDPSKRKAAWDQIKVIALTTDGVLYLMREEMTYLVRQFPSRKNIQREHLLDFAPEEKKKKKKGSDQTTMEPTALTPLQLGCIGLPPGFNEGGGVSAVNDDTGGAKTKSDGKNCTACLEHLQAWGRNMSQNGPSRLYKTALTAFDFLKIFGLQDKHEKALIRACQISLAAMDAESVTLRLHEGKKDGFLDTSHYHHSISQTRVPSEKFARQLPVLLGFTDVLSLEEEGGGGGCDIIMLPSNDAQDGPSFQSFIGEFLDLIEKRQKRAQQEKEALLKPLFDWLEPYKKGHFQFFNSRGINDRQEGGGGRQQVSTETGLHKRKLLGIPRGKSKMIKKARFVIGHAAKLQQSCNKPKAAKRKGEMKPALQAWKHSLWGQFESRLIRLVHSYKVGCFNGARYDYVLLAAHLITHMKNTKPRTKVGMQAPGNAVNSITLGHVKFFECQKMLTPSSSLRTLAKMTQTEEVKGFFPFDRFVSMEYLQEKKLPSDAADWTSMLQGGKGPSQLEVDACLALFELKKFDNILQYLKYYLNLDVIILVKSMMSLFDTNYELTGIHPLEANKLTLSSFAFHSTQSHLMHDKRIGQFSVNHTLKYGLLKLGTRGGTSQVYRHVAGKKADYSSYQKMAEGLAAQQGLPPPHPDQLKHCNGHLLGPEKSRDASYLIALDVGALYPYAGNHICCFVTLVTRSALPNGKAFSVLPFGTTLLTSSRRRD